MRKFIIRGSLLLLLLLLLVVVGVPAYMWWLVRGSLPQMAGETKVAGITEQVTVERDALGIPTIRAKNRQDLAFATGYVHAQERFFQMDLLRRNSAGELAELVGPAVVDQDRKHRVHRFRHVAELVAKASTPEDQQLTENYAAGVNAGLQALRSKPFEYLLLGVEPAPWVPADTVLVMFSMYLDLQGEDHVDESTYGLMHDLMPAGLYEFLAPRGTMWDAPIDGEPLPVAALPGPDVFDLRKVPAAVTSAAVSHHSTARDPDTLHLFDGFSPGSNNWAVAGSRSKHGGAMVADDMHLGISVPNIWFRASFDWKNAAGQDRKITGVTLPGTPAMVVGSNEKIAWGFTNSEGDWVDLVVLEADPNDPDAYLTPEGPKKFEHHQEVIRVADQPDEKFEVLGTIWGPVIDTDHNGNRRALRWVGHGPEGVNADLLHMEDVDTLEAALDLANRCGSPAQNFVVAAADGRIAWTILGRIPKRVGFDGRLPTSWADGSKRWDGWLEPSEYPRVVNPESGLIWTANARVVSGDMLAKLGDGGYDLGARAGQIRDDLRALDKASEQDMLAIQLDDKAKFLERWQKQLLELLSSDATGDNPGRAEFRAHVEKWSGRAAADSVGFRLVREFRLKAAQRALAPLGAVCHAANPDFELMRLDMSEDPAWRLISEQPEHLLDPKFKSWNEFKLSIVDEMIAEATKSGGKLADYTWGKHNTAKIQHPFSRLLTSLSSQLDMPAEPLAGDSAHMPRIQRPSGGASERMAVSPGKEKEGYLHMPCGQSGHPLSRHYRDGHDAWVKGERTPFLPGPAINTLVLKPAK